MDHSKIQKMLLLLDSPDFSEEVRREITMHARGCRECSEVLARWACIHGMLTIVASVQAPHGMEEKIMRRLEGLEIRAKEPSSVSRPWEQWLFPTIGYAFALLFMVVAIAHWEPYLNANPSTEEVLLSNIPQGGQIFFTKEPPSINQLLVQQS